MARRVAACSGVLLASFSLLLLGTNIDAIDLLDVRLRDVYEDKGWYNPNLEDAGEADMLPGPQPAARTLKAAEQLSQPGADVQAGSDAPRAHIPNTATWQAVNAVEGLGMQWMQPAQLANVSGQAEGSELSSQGRSLHGFSDYLRTIIPDAQMAAAKLAQRKARQEQKEREAAGTIPAESHTAGEQHAHDVAPLDQLYDHQLLMKDLKDAKRIRRRKCRQVRGTWCGQFERQPPVPDRPVPRGSKACKENCNGVGVCNHDTGICDCPAGWMGDDCKTPFKRPCSNRHRDPKNNNEDKWAPTSHIDKDGRDINWLDPGWQASRCSGICDDTDASCWCDGKYGRKPAPPGSPPGTPPAQMGRPLSEFCGKAQQDKEGRKTSWGNVPYAKLYEPGKGWCEADTPKDQYVCDSCQLDGMGGPLCDLPLESFCLNQCSGHGDCKRGFCKCHDGWYGTDCSRKVAGAVMESSLEYPWNKKIGMGTLPPAAALADPGTRAAAAALVDAAAAANPPRPGGANGLGGPRKRPLIYVYDVPAEFTQRMLQYRLLGFHMGNETQFNDWIYGVELYFHEMLMLSSHRTYDPAEADYFYVPLYVTCYFWPTLGWADTPWFGAPTGVSRVMQGAYMALKAKRWLEQTFPYWKARGGRDHIFLMTADEGACWLPKEVYDSAVILTHWGRMDLNHTSNTAYFQDNYSMPYVQDPWQKYDWREDIQGHACYSPEKDLVIPSLKPPSHYQHSPLMGAEPYERDILLYFRGDVGHNRQDHYSRGIRQKVYKLSLAKQWRDKYKIFVGRSDELPGSYSQHLARAKFCLVAPGDGWSARAEDAVLHGCIPVVVMDMVHAVFESILDWDTFSVRVSESHLESLPEILLSVTDDQIARMQRRLGTVWQRFAYMRGKPVLDEAGHMIGHNLRTRPIEQSALPKWYPLQRATAPHVEDDAFGTIMQWLYARIPFTRGP